MTKSRPRQREDEEWTPALHGADNPEQAGDCPCPSNRGPSSMPAAVGHPWTDPLGAPLLA